MINAARLKVGLQDRKITIKIAGEQCDDGEDGALTGGPFSALCASMRPGEEERKTDDEEVQATICFKLIVSFNLLLFFKEATQGSGPNAQPLYTWDEFGFRVEEEDGPEDTSSKLLSIPFTEVFCDDDAMLRREKGVKQTKTDEIRLRLFACLKYIYLIPNAVCTVSPEFHHDHHHPEHYHLEGHHLDDLMSCPS